MKKIEKVKLSPYEATAFYWINMIKKKLAQISHGMVPVTNNEKEFYMLFKDYGDEQWRSVFLQLSKDIKLDTEKYIETDNSDMYHQETTIGEHNDLNRSLKKIVGRTIPDIRLQIHYLKDSVIYTCPNFAEEWSKSVHMEALPKEYDPEYIIDGDEENFHFYNLLLSTMYMMQYKNCYFNSTDILRERFSKKYMKDNTIPDEDKDHVIDKFNYYFDLANSKGLIIGKSDDDAYLMVMDNNHLIRLDKYFGKAYEYSDEIINQSDEHTYIKQKKNE